MSKSDQDFLIERNIERFSRLLKTEDDAGKRSTLKFLLREERAKQIDTSPDNDIHLRGHDRL